MPSTDLSAVHSPERPLHVGGGGSSRRLDALGLVWVVGCAFAVLVPALAHGASLGPYNLLRQSGLSYRPGSGANNNELLDQIQAFIPWTSLAWQQVHHGHLPLWNPYSGLGMPLAFNWQSATFSVPALIGYVVPLRLAYTVQVIVTLVIAGTGVYVLGRMLRLSVLGCVMAATTFELSGSFIGWLGWSVAGVMSWAGWLFAAALLVLRGEHRVRAVTVLAVVLACSVYAGQPETLGLLGLALLVWIGVMLCQRTKLFGGTGPILRPLIDTTIGVVAGLGLAAPLIAPGVQVLARSIRQGEPGGPPLGVRDLTHFVFQGFDGLPIAGSALVASKTLYSETAAYVGVIAVVLVVVAPVARWRRPEVPAFAVVTAVTGG